MVRRPRRSFRRDENGVVLVEALLTMPIVVLMMMAMVEVGMVLFQWNMTIKGLHVGARLAAVSDPIVGDTAYETLTSDETSILAGDAVPAAVTSVSCGAGTTPCDATRLARLMTGGDTCQSNQTGGIHGICDVAVFINPDNIRITYYRAGLGYVGRPFGTVSTIRLELINQHFDFLFLDQLIPILGRINIPSHAVTITSEDLSDTTT